jgi:pimeloyl-ACP methyl ester carboxylesterase
VVLLHGYTSSARDTWIQTGIAGRLAAGGRRVIMPDMRGHGASAKPRDPAAYPADALTDDGLALIAELELSDYDLGGYSLGARIAARMLALGARPGRAVLGGTGLEPIVHAAGRGGIYRRILSQMEWSAAPGGGSAVGAFEPGSSEAQFEEYLRTSGADPVALIRVLDTFVDTPRELLARVDVSTLVIAGEADTARGSVEELAAVFPHGELRRVAGDHWSALVSAELADEFVRFLGS